MLNLRYGNWDVPSFGVIAIGSNVNAFKRQGIVRKKGTPSRMSENVSAFCGQQNVRHQSKCNVFVLCKRGQIAKSFFPNVRSFVPSKRNLVTGRGIPCQRGNCQKVEHKMGFKSTPSYEEHAQYLVKFARVARVINIGCGVRAKANYMLLVGGHGFGHDADDNSKRIAGMACFVRDEFIKEMANFVQSLNG